MPAPSRIVSPYLNGKRWSQLVSAALTVVAVLVLLLVPQYSSSSSDSAGHGSTQLVTALEANGPRFLIAVAIPLVLALVPLAVRGPAWRHVSLVCTVLFCAFTAVAFLSIGIYLFPAAVVQIVTVVNRNWRHLT